MNEDVIISVREDGSRVVESSLNRVADATAKAGGAQDLLQKTLNNLSGVLVRVAASMDRLGVIMQAHATGAQAVAAADGAVAKAAQGVASSASASATALQAKTQATAEAAAANLALAETEAQAQARIHAMITASMEQAAIEKQRLAETMATSQAMRVAADSNSAFAKSSTELAAAQSLSMQRYTALRAPVAELQALLEKRKLTTDDVIKAEALLDAAQKAGAISTAELKEAFALLDAAKIKDIAVTKAQTVAEKEHLLNARAQAEIGTLLSEVASGNFGRLRRSGASLANQTGLLTKLMSPLGLAIVGVGTAVGVTIAAFIKGEAESANFARALIAVGGYAGVTNIQLHDMAASISDSTLGQAKNALLALASTGKFTGDQLHTAAQAAVDMANVTGESLESAVKSITALRDDPVNAIQKLNEQFHFLDLATFQQIQRLQELGQTQQAADLAEQTYADNLRSRAAQIQENLGTVQRFWNMVKDAASSAWDAMMGIGRKPSGELAGIEAGYDALLKRKQALDDISHGGMGLSTGLIEMARYPDILGMTPQQMASESASIGQSLELLRGKMQSLQTQAKDKSIAEQMKADGIAAEAYTNNMMKGFDKIKDRADAVARVTARLNAIVSANGALPAGVEQLGQTFSGKGFDYLVNKELGASGKTKVDHTAERDAKQYQQALQNLLDTINPTDAAMRKLTDAQNLLQKAVAKGDITQQQADFNLSLYQAQIQDTINPLEALNKKMDEKLQAAQDGTKAQTAANQAQDDANNLLKQGIVVGEQWVEQQARKYEAIKKATDQQKLLSQIQKSVLKQQQDLVNTLTVLNELEAKGPGAGGITHQQGVQYMMNQNPDIYEGTQDKLNNQYQLYQAYYQKIDALRQAGYLSEQGAAQATAMNDARLLQLRLQKTTDFFGALSTLASSHNSKLAAIGKAAAIAEAIMNTYVGATKALAQGGIYGSVMAAIVIAQGLMNVAQIRSTNYGSYRTGGEFVVGGSGGPDSQHVSFMASPGEHVRINTPSQARALEGGGQAQEVNVPVTIVNAKDPEEAIHAMNTAGGKRVLLNQMKSDPDSFKRVLGIN